MARKVAAPEKKTHKTRGYSQNPEKHENGNDNENDRKNITAGTVTEFLAGKFESKRRRPPNFSWQSDALRLAELLKLDLDATFEKKNGGKSYKIADSWYRLFCDGGEQTAARLEARIAFLPTKNAFSPCLQM
jgi:hypothetical protein